MGKLKLRHHKSEIALHAPMLCTPHSAFDRYRESCPRKVNYTKIAILVIVMNKVQFLLASEPSKPLKPRSLYIDIPC